MQNKTIKQENITINKALKKTITQDNKTRQLKGQQKQTMKH